MTLLRDWLDRHTARAPAALRTRVLEYGDSVEAETHAEALARAGQVAIDRVLSHAGDRSAALDLLAADALITLALLAQVESAPEGLEAFARSVLQATRPAA